MSKAAAIRPQICREFANTQSKVLQVTLSISQVLQSTTFDSHPTLFGTEGVQNRLARTRQQAKSKKHFS